MDSVGKPKNWIGPLLAILLGLLILAALFVGFVPIEDCPGLKRIDIEGARPLPWDPLDPANAEWRARRAQHFVSKRCALCGGSGRVSLLKKWTNPWQEAIP